jgi:hypothetical protein
MSSETDRTFDESFRRRVSEHAYGSECEQARDLAAAPDLKRKVLSVSTSPALPNHATATVIGARKRGLAYGPQDDGDVGSGISGLIQN